MSENPCNMSKPMEKREFYNRKEEIELAYEYIRNSQSFSIIGENCIGRTSFLKHIISRHALEENGIDPEHYVIVYFEMNGVSVEAKEMFIEAIVKDIVKQTQIKIGHMDIFDQFETLIELLASNGKNLVIAIDELEVVSPLLDCQLSRWLRYILQRPNIMAITVSQKTIKELEPRDLSSPLYTIFVKLRLGLFSRKETEKMIHSIFSEKEIMLKEEEVSFMADISGGNPHLIRLLRFCYSRRITKDDFKVRMLDQVKDIFEGYWENLREEERRFLINVEISGKNWIGHDLEERGFLIRKQGRWRVFSPLFQEFIGTRPSPRIEKDMRNEEYQIKKIESAILLPIIRGIIASLIAILIWEYFRPYPDFYEFFGEKIIKNEWIASLFIYFVRNSKVVYLIFLILFCSVILFLLFRKIKNSQVLSRKGVCYYFLAVTTILILYLILKLTNLG